MKKKITFAILALGGILTFSSCGEEEIYVGENFSPDNQEIIDKINNLSYPVGFAESDAVYKDMEPEAFSNEITTEGKSITGYYGYIDLGLSVKWATSNLGSVCPVNYVKTLEETLQTIEEERNITPTEKPTLSTIVYPAIMAYEEYLECDKLEQIYNEYKYYCSEKTSAHEDAISQYDKSHDYLFAIGDGYPWGGTSMWDFLGSDGTAPINIAGNEDYDVATRILGDGWSMPTMTQWQELTDKCIWKNCGGYYLVTGPSGKQIILPFMTYHIPEQASERKPYYIKINDTNEFNPTFTL